MLPFLKPKKMSSMILAKVKPTGEVETKGEEGEHDPGLMSAAEDMIAAFHAKDAHGVASAFKAAHDMCASAIPDDDDSGSTEGE